MDEASAAADPPPGVGSEELNASRRSRTERSTSMHEPTFLDDRSNRVRADAYQIDGRTVDDYRIHLLAGLEAADARVSIERIRRVDRRGDERFVEREAHA